MVVEKIDKEDFIQLISNFLASIGLPFQQEGESWIAEHRISGETSQIVVNGQLVKTEQQDHIIQLKIEIMGQGDVRTAGGSEPEDEFLQIRFSLLQDGQVVRDLEDCIYMQNDIEQFKSTFVQIFS